MNKFLVFALPVIATGFLYSCTSDIESAEDILGKASSSSEQGVSSGNPPPSSSSTSMPSGSVMCVVSGTCAEIHADVCSALSGIVVQSCPASSSSSASPSSSSPAPPSSSGVVPSSSSAGQSSSSVLPSSSGVVVSSSSGGLSSSSVLPSSSSVVMSSSSATLSVTSGTFVDTRDNKTYKWVKIGTQTWMAENLNYAAEGSKCYGNSEANCGKYGRLYNWSTARTVCPSGWHLPSDGEWNTLTNDVGGSNTAGTKLKATTGWNNRSDERSGNGTDDYGFSALPGGFGYSGGSFFNVGTSGLWWSATGNDSDSAYYRAMSYGYSNVRRDIDLKSGLFSVRCVQD